MPKATYTIKKKVTIPKTPMKKIIHILTRKRLYFFLVIAGIAAMALFLYLFILKDIPKASTIGFTNYPQSTKIYDRHNKLLYTVYASRNQSFTPLSKIPKTLQQATIAIEDRDFYNHGPIDIRGIIRSLYSIVFKKQIQGGSTITQQLVKTSLLTLEQSITRKVKEVILAGVVESIYSKDKILEMYLNQVSYGGTSWGVESASEIYFDKQVKDLDLAESAFLAGLPQAPSQYSPFGTRPDLGKQRQEEVIRQMLDQKYITKDQANKAIAEELKFSKIPNKILAPHFVLYIKKLLEDKYGERTVGQGGLSVTTSLDLDLQNYAQATVAAEVESLKGNNVSNGAAMITDPGTGEILAMVGSRNYFDTEHDGNVNVALALRQPGSSIKPINYAVGLIKGYTASTPFIDQPTCFNGGPKPYCPLNYDLKWHGIVQMRPALANSLNIPAVKMLKLNGLDAMIATASAMGITTFDKPDRYGLSLTLGGGEVTMLEMTQAFGVFANNGYRINLHPILKITNHEGKVLEEYKPPTNPIFGKKVLPEGVSYIISQILSDNAARALEFGTNSPLKVGNYPVAVKTGTTNDYRDNWTIGYTPSFLVAVWVGNNDNSQMNGVVSGITGAAPIWHDLMAHLLDGTKPQQFAKPDNVVGKSVCSDTGQVAPADGTPDRCPTRFEYFIKGMENSHGFVTKENVFVDKGTQALAKPGQTDNVEQKEEVIVTDPTGDKYCVTCAHPEMVDPNKKP